MRHILLAPMLVLLGATAASPQPAPFELPAGSWCGDPIAPDGPPTLLAGYGGGGFTIRTKSPQAQAFFNNGMQLAHAFAHKAAIAAFQEARRLDPDCAMCAWGEAWSAGPTINYGVTPAEAKKLAEIAGTAERLAADAPASERGYIAALKLRYPAKGDGNRAFADAMDALAKASPNDDEIATIAADALMIASKYTPASMTRPVELLEAVLKRSPDYTPAIHFYIHATEIAGFPERAEKFADRLPVLAPSASHLVHMPGHTYYWIGRYDDAALANVHAVALGHENAARLKLPEPDGVWTLAYHGHNVHFGLAGALMAGDAPSGLALARPTIEAAAHAGTMPRFRQIVLGMAYIAVARFAPPEQMFGLADPGTANPAAQAQWHYARGEALVARGDTEAILREAGAIPQQMDGDKSGMSRRIFALSRYVLQGRVAMLQGRYDKAARIFAKAAKIEETKPLSEATDPPAWWYPVRRDVAAALLAAGDAKGALAAADASLKRRPRDPIALATRAQAEAKLGHAAAASHDVALARAGWRGRRDSIGG